MSALAVARALHVLAVVIWIGGVTIVTLVVLPAIRRGALGADRNGAFEAIERRFVWYARGAVILAGATGFYMVEQLGLWSWFHSARFWWMHAMVGVWTIFALVLFVIEPLGLNRRLRRGKEDASQETFARLQRAHIILLILALITIFGAVAGSHG